VTRPDGWTVLNADDPLVASVARRVHCRVAYFSTAPRTSRVLARHRRAGGRAWVLDEDVLWEWEGTEAHRLLAVADLPIALGGLAGYNVANALAAAGGARALGATREAVAAGLRDFRPSAALSPGRLNLFSVGGRTVIVDFAHNEAGTEAILDVALLLAHGAPVTAIIGTAGDRPDETLLGIGRIAAGRAHRVVVKETLGYLRGRDREEVVRLLLDGVAQAGVDPTGVPVHRSETAALEAVLGSPAQGLPDGRPEEAGVIVLFCHAERAEVFDLLARHGAVPLDLSVVTPGGPARP
jgi:cyanophycin synthetase